MRKDRPIAFYPQLARELESINAALFYQQIYFWSDKGSREDGWIYKTAEEFEWETCLTEKQQRLARETLIEKGYIEAEKLMHKNSMVWHYKPLVDIEVQLAKSHLQPAERPVATSKKASSSYTENTTENTTPENPKTDLSGFSKKKEEDVTLIPLDNDGEIILPRRASGFIKQNFKRPRSAPIPTLYTADFERFWKLYPKKVNKKLAFDMWRPLSVATKQSIIIVLPNHILSEQWKTENGKYIPNPENWLEAEKWLDDVKPSKKSFTQVSMAEEIDL